MCKSKNAMDLLHVRDRGKMSENYSLKTPCNRHVKISPSASKSLLIIRLEVVMVTKPWYVKKLQICFIRKKTKSYGPRPS
jgi:hypothetical protein